MFPNRDQEAEQLLAEVACGGLIGCSEVTVDEVANGAVRRFSAETLRLIHDEDIATIVSRQASFQKWSIPP